MKGHNGYGKILYEVDTDDRTEMITFLTNHFRYSTMNSWNRSTSYANNVKIHNLGFDKETLETAWEMLGLQEVFDDIRVYLNDWAYEHNYSWQAGFNGKSGGYLVLTQGSAP